MENNDIQKDFYDKAFREAHVWKDSDFPQSNQYLNNRFLDMAFKNKPQNILEMGCGNGLLTFFLLKRPGKITAVDVSDKAIENMRGQFRAEAEKGKLKLAADDLINFLEKTEEEFDLVIGSGIIHHIEKKDWEKLYRLIYKKLKPGGIFSCAPEPNGGGIYKLCWRLARYVYKFFGIEYDWEVEKGTLDMVPGQLEKSLKKAGFQNAEILPFQALPHFHLKLLAYIDRKMINWIKGKFSLYIIIKAEKMRRVPVATYDNNYFEERYKITDEKMVENTGSFEHIYVKSASFLKLKENDKVVDLGCGSGQMSICLNHKFKCDVTGVDYSQDAIRLCNRNLQKFLEKGGKADSEKIRFLCYNNSNLPEFSGVKAVFMLDFLEHLYPEEIEILLEKIKKWNDEKIYLVIRTDNRYYQKFVRPVGDLLSIYFSGASKKTLEENRQIEARWHVNIMTARAVRKILAKHGFRTIGVRYPEIDAQTMKNQMEVFGKYKILLYPAIFAGKVFRFLLPSFYILAKHDNKS